MIRFISALCQGFILYFAVLGLTLAINDLLPAIPGPILCVAFTAAVVGFIAGMVTQ